MNTLVIYDNAGYILSTISGESEKREPIGIPFLWMEVPKGKRIKTTNGIGVDVSVTPHQVILENIPKSEIQILTERQDATENALLDLLLLGGM